MMHCNASNCDASKPRRLGFTLVEMLVAITLSSSVMLTAVALVHQAFEYQSATRDRVQQTSTFNRFAEQFRRDVHWAQQMESTAQGIELIGPAGEPITYVAADNVLTRSQVVEGKHHVERVELSPDSEAFLEMERAPLCAMLTVEVQRNPNQRQLVRKIVVAMSLLNAAANSPSAESATTDSHEVQL